MKSSKTQTDKIEFGSREDRQLADELYVLRNIQTAEELSKGWHDQIKHWRELYDGKHYSSRAKTGEIQYVDPTYTNTVDLTVGLFLKNRMSWQAKGFNPSFSENTNTDDLEKFLSAVIDINSARREYSILYEIYTHFVRDGSAALYTVWDSTIEKSSERDTVLLQGETVETEALLDLPIHVEAVDPLSLFVLPGGSGRWLAQVREVEMSLYDVYMRYGKIPEAYNSLTLSEMVTTNITLKDYWDAVYDIPLPVAKSDQEIDTIPARKITQIRNATLVNDKFLIPLRIMDGYKNLPYDIGFYKPISRTDPKGWLSAIAPLEESVMLLERGVNRRQRLIDVYASLPIVAETQAGRSVKLGAGLGEVINITPGERVYFPQWQGMPPDVDKQLQFISSRVQQTGYSEVMYGGGTDTESGWALSQLADQGRIRLEQPITHLKLMFTIWAEKVLDLVRSFGEDKVVYIYGRTKRNSFADYLSLGEILGYKVECEMDPLFASEQTRKHAMATQVRGILPDKTIIEKYFDIQQAGDEIEQREIEQTMNHPAMTQYTIFVHLQQLAAEGDLAAQMAFETMKQQLLPSLMGENNQMKPAGAAGLTGTQSQTGETPVQAVSNVRPGASTADAVTDMSRAAPNMKGSVE